MRAAQHNLIQGKLSQEGICARILTRVCAVVLVSLISLPVGMAKAVESADQADAVPALGSRGDLRPTAAEQQNEARLRQPGFISAGNAGVSREPAHPLTSSAAPSNEPVAATPPSDKPHSPAVELNLNSSAEHPEAKAQTTSWLNDFVPLWRQVIGANGDSAAPPSVAMTAATPRYGSDASTPGSAMAGPPADPVNPTTVTNHVQSSVTALWQPLSMRQDSHANPASGAGNQGSQQGNLATINRPIQDLGATLRQTPLFAQLAFATNGDLMDSNRADAETASTKLVAYLQEASPEPKDVDIDSAEELVPEPPATDAQRDDAGANGAESLAEAQQVGEEPEDRSLEFLRTETVLLKPGESQCDVGINYLLTETDFPILLADDMGNIVAVDEVSFRIRELSVPLQYRLGLHPRVQGFLGMPIGWSNTQVALDAFDAFQNDGGIGDLDFGLTMQLVDASVNCPYVIATVQGTAPTGGDPFTSVVGLAPTAPSLGQGFWSVAGNLLCIQPYDPVVVFYGLGVERFFAREFVGLDIEPGTQYNYTFGVGFAVNERITLSTRFFGAYVEEIEVDDQRRFGTNTEPMTIRLSATISQPCDRLVEPFVEFGITDDAVSSFLGITCTCSPHSHHKPQERDSAHAKK
jgi:hypothetical protein